MWLLDFSSPFIINTFWLGRLEFSRFSIINCESIINSQLSNQRVFHRCADPISVRPTIIEAICFFYCLKITIVTRGFFNFHLYSTLFNILLVWVSLEWRFFAHECCVLTQMGVLYIHDVDWRVYFSRKGHRKEDHYQRARWLRVNYLYHVYCWVPLILAVKPYSAKDSPADHEICGKPEEMVCEQFYGWRLGGLHARL